MNTLTIWFDEQGNQMSQSLEVSRHELERRDVIDENDDEVSVGIEWYWKSTGKLARRDAFLDKKRIPSMQSVTGRLG